MSIDQNRLSPKRMTVRVFFSQFHFFYIPYRIKRYNKPIIYHCHFIENKKKGKYVFIKNVQGTH